MIKHLEKLTELGYRKGKVHQRDEVKFIKPISCSVCHTREITYIGNNKWEGVIKLTSYINSQKDIDELQISLNNLLKDVETVNKVGN